MKGKKNCKAKKKCSPRGDVAIGLGDGQQVFVVGFDPCGRGCVGVLEKVGVGVGVLVGVC